MYAANATQGICQVHKNSVLMAKGKQLCIEELRCQIGGLSVAHVPSHCKIPGSEKAATGTSLRRVERPTSGGGAMSVEENHDGRLLKRRGGEERRLHLRDRLAEPGSSILPIPPITIPCQWHCT